MKQQKQMQEGGQYKKEDISKYNIITYVDDPNKMEKLKQIIVNTNKINQTIFTELEKQSTKIDEVQQRAENISDNVQKGNQIVKETSKKYGFFRTLKLKLAAFFGVAGAATGNPITGAIMGAGAYGLGTIAENRNNKQLDKMDK